VDTWAHTTPAATPPTTPKSNTATSRSPTGVRNCVECISTIPAPTLASTTGTGTGCHETICVVHVPGLEDFVCGAGMNPDGKLPRFFVFYG
jgi:hypothetical protein